MTSLEAIAGDELVGWLEIPVLDQWRALRPGDSLLFALGVDMPLRAVVLGELAEPIRSAVRRRHLWLFVALWASPGALPRLVLRVDDIPLGVLMAVRGFRPNLRPGQLWTLPAEWDDFGV